MAISNVWRAASIGLAIVLPAGCGTASAPSSIAPPPAATLTAVAGATPLGVMTKCLGPFRPGDYVPLACFVFVQDGTAPGSTHVGAFADLRIFGGSAPPPPRRCPAGGGPPSTLEGASHFPADMSPGLKTFPIWATDAQGRRADTTATIEIVAR